MSPLARRVFIALDEWLGIVLLAWLRAQHDPLFWYVLGAWAVSVYVFSYFPHWMNLWRGK